MLHASLPLQLLSSRQRRAHHVAANSWSIRPNARRGTVECERSCVCQGDVGSRPRPLTARPTWRKEAAVTPIIKICGLSTAATLEAALAAGADMVGFVFFPKSPRHVGYETARDLGRRARGR